ncbi:MAG TPA: glycosyltransferase [Anaerolineales bacterium]|nr:glycosyltransferase [Anaerolineales bacterium]
MKNELASVIIVAKNSEAYLASAIKSALEQEYKPFEIIVVDGRSTDRTAEIAQSTEGVRYFMQRDQGLANARNFAIRAAAGRFIAFLDSDDVWARGKLQTQMKYLAANPDCEATVTWLRYISEPDHVLRHHPRQRPYDPIGYTPSALVARRGLFEKVGLFDPLLSVGCDADWFARLFDSRLPFAVVPEFLLNKRIHQTNLSRDIAQSRKETLVLLQNSISRKRKMAGKL